jgi:hypothetical protein
LNKTTSQEFNENTSQELNETTVSNELPSSISTSFANIIDYMATEISDKINNGNLGNTGVQNGFKAVAKGASNLNLQ